MQSKNLLIKALGILMIAAAGVTVFIIVRQRNEFNHKLAQTEEREQEVEEQLQKSIQYAEAKRVEDPEPGAAFFADESHWKRVGFPGTGVSFVVPGGLTNTLSDVEPSTQSLTHEVQYFKVEIPGDLDGYASYFEYKPEAKPELDQTAENQLLVLRESPGYELIDAQKELISVGDMSGLSLTAQFKFLDKVKVMRSLLFEKGSRTWQLTFYHHQDYASGTSYVDRIFTSVQTP